MLRQCGQQTLVTLEKYQKTQWTRFMAQCERNYIALMTFFADTSMRRGQTYRINQGNNWAMVLQVIDHESYTTTLKMSFTNTLKLKWLKPLCLTVRIYHDAKLAEVVVQQVGPPNSDLARKYAFNDQLTQWLTELSTSNLNASDRDRGDIN